MRTSRGILIYPSTEMEAISYTAGDIQVETSTFDVSIDIDEAGGRFLQEILETIT